MSDKTSSGLELSNLFTVIELLEDLRTVNFSAEVNEEVIDRES